MTQTLTGYPSIDKPWLKYYSEEAIKKQLKPDTIYGHLWESNKDYLDNIALVYFERKITFRKLFNLIEQCKSSLNALGIKKGDIVTVQTLAIPQSVVLIYALSRIGAIANLIYASNTEEEVNHLLKKTNSCAYFVIDSIYEKFSYVLKETKVKNVVVLSIDSEMDFLTKTIYRVHSQKKKFKECKNVYSWSSFLQIQSSEEVIEVTEDSLPVVMVYTGGTTGISKGVVLTNRSLNELVFQYEKADMGFKRQDIFMDSLPPFIAFGVSIGLHLPLCMGIKTVLIVDPSPQNQGKMFEKYKPNYYVAGPVQVEAVVNHVYKNPDLSFIKILATGGDALPASREKNINSFLKEHNCNTCVVQGYGMSELAATVCTGSATVQRFGTVGIPLPNTIVKLLDIESGKEVSYGEQGEICIFAPSVMQGYYNNAEETKNILIKHDDGLEWIHTGDIGIMDADGFLTIIGRIKRMILVKENTNNTVYQKVFPKMLEAQLEKIEGVQSAVIVGNGLSADVQKLIAYIVPSEKTVDLETKIRQFVKMNFKEYEQPENYRFVEQLPRTKIGKVDYRALEQEAQNVQ